MADKVVITIPGRLRGLNEHINACRTSWALGASAKAEELERIAWVIKMSRPPHITGAVRISFAWYEKDKKRDPDNIISAKKVILDALVAQHVINGDGWKYLADPEPFRDRLYVDKDNPRIVVTITPGICK